MNTDKFIEKFGNYGDLGGRDVPHPGTDEFVDVIQGRHGEDLMKATLYEAGLRLIEKMTSADNRLEAMPFNDERSKQEMVDHLIRYHGITEINGYTLSGSTKVTKDRMQSFHDHVHEVLDDPRSVFAYRGNRYEHGGGFGPQFVVEDVQGRSVPLPVQPHTHGLVTLSDEQRAALEQVRDNQRVTGTVTSVQDRKVLTNLVDNDFRGLKQDMRAFAADVLAARKREIDAEWDDREQKIPDFATEATELHRESGKEWDEMIARQQEEKRLLQEQHDDAFKAVSDRAAEAGVTLEQTTRRVEDPDHRGKTQTATVYVAVVKGRKEAHEAAVRDNAAYLERALLTLERQRLAAQRQVLLTGVPDDAMPILDSIPAAEEMMRMAQQDGDSQTRQITSNNGGD